MNVRPCYSAFLRSISRLASRLMKLPEALVASVLVATICLVPGRVDAEEKIIPWKGAPKECRDRQSTKCIVYPTDWNTPFYKGPSTKAPIGKYPHFDINSYRADPGDLKGARWVRLHHIDIGNRTEDLGDRVVWVERINLLRYSELRPVTRCWRIKRMYIQAGDAPGGIINFKRDGTGIITYDQGGRPEKVRAWYKSDVFSIRYVASGGNGPSGKEFSWGYVYSMAIVHQVGWIAPGEIEDFFEDDPACESGTVTE